MPCSASPCLLWSKAWWYCATVILSWLTILLYERIPFGLRLISNPSQVAATRKMPSLYARLRQLVSQ